MVTLDGNESFQANLRLNHFESLRLASRLHSDCKKEDCYDFVKWLPLELVLRIFSYLRPGRVYNCISKFTSMLFFLNGGYFKLLKPVITTL
ncbi:hypothetical protein TSMEX_011151 [Taenia solium]|eukprot:TsM_001069700 transcript=TsM_001069700 gene=TsM_001069700